ncbi:dihydroorotase [Zeaxanthinibacter enoshimensis]|uniref:Dihydroorotase n=1 Tax=Zeaxanthinibacter enoshimensis TaxID=392009 RepID=A0A4R6TKN4_9FLAO|nr:dihydroorotase [Zeaxanthinibacter enoshimensis]TDQ31514.1 dihydroorotase [Zeaxanthinibacter enoshimensis]
MNLLLKSAKIIAPSNSQLHLKKRDILIRNGKIAQIAASIEADKSVKLIDFKNLHVSAGWFDSSVSFGEPGYEERETIDNGLRTAGKSGFTDVVLNPNTMPVPDSSSDIVFLRNQAKGRATALHPLGTLTVKGQGSDLAELFDMRNSGAVGFYDYKQAISNSNLLKIALLYARNFDGLVHSFPRDNQIAGNGIANEGKIATSLGLKGVPALAEALQVARDLYILEYTGGKLHIPTLSTPQAVQLVQEAKKKGLDVSCSVPIHNLLFTDEKLLEFDSEYKTNPPLRTASDARSLVKAVEKGIIDLVTTDHSPLNIEEKRVEFEQAGYGTIGLETAFGSLQRLFSLETTIELLTRGRDRYGIDKVEISEGEEAKLTLFDPDREFTFSEEQILSASKNSMFLGEKMKGYVYGVIANGKTELKKKKDGR